MTLSTSEGSYPLEIEFYSSDVFVEFDGKKFPEPVKLYHSSTVKGKDKDLLFFDMLFSYKDIREDFQTIIRNWYERQENLKPILGLFINTFYNPRVFNENIFLNLAQALESYHRKFVRNETLSEDEHKARVKDILHAVKDEHRQWLASKFAFRNEPVLSERLEELLPENSNQTLNKTIPQSEEFVQRLKDIRNYYTHFDERLKKKAAKWPELFYLTERMKVLLTSCLLRSCGFSRELIQSLLARIEFRYFNHLLRE